MPQKVMPQLPSYVKPFTLSSLALLATLLGMGLGYFVLLSTEWGAILGGIALAGSVVRFACTGELQAARVLLFVGGTSLAGAGVTDLLNFPESNSDVWPGFIVGLVAGLLLVRAIWGTGFNVSSRSASALSRSKDIAASLAWASLWIAIPLVWNDDWTDEPLGRYVGRALIGAAVLTAQLLQYRHRGSRQSRSAQWIGFIAMLATIIYITASMAIAFSLNDSVAFLLFVGLLAGIVFWVRKYGPVAGARRPTTAFKLTARRSAIMMSFAIPGAVLAFYYEQAALNLAVNISPTEWVAMGDAQVPFGAPFKVGNERFIRLMMNDYYYFRPRNDALMTTPEQFMRNLASDPWSYAETTKESADFDAGVGKDVGIYQVEKGGKSIIAYVDHISPAARAGYKRGDHYVPHSLKSGRHKFDEVLHHVIRRPDGTIGYLWIMNFSEDAEYELDDAFGQFRRAGIKELIIDLRYNPGGRLPVKLASLILGRKHNGAVIWHAAYSDKYQDKNQDFRVSDLGVSPPIKRVFVLTTGDTCSASEAIINGLRPYLPVITIGQKTCGKPYMMDPLEYDGFDYDPVTAKIFNSRGKADYQHGVKPDCKVQETFNHPVDQPGDALLGAALYYRKHNACPSVL